MMEASLCLHVYAKYINTMSNEYKTVHEFDYNLICDFFSNMKRQGPGSPEVTLQALSFVDNLTDKSLIADIGCGTGGQTMTLAEHVQGKITGVDLAPQFIKIFNRNAVQLGLQDRVKGITGSMDSLPFKNEELDLIWSEGAIYNIGFERGLNEWRKFLKTGGYIAISESSWFTDERPAEINDFWMEAYPEIDTIPNQIAKIYKAGYLPIATFILQENCWTEHYFVPNIAAQKIFLNKYAGNKAAEEFVASEQYEAKLYHKYKDFYGYTFFIAKKTEQ
jgi:Methylase involved in ubiquinone/menaquinone biosynthesis